MLSAWTKHLKDQELKDEFEKYIRGSKRLLERLDQLLKEEEGNLDHIEMSTKTFDSPNWAYRQAYNNGFRCCLKMLHKLINLDHKDTK